jgi:hypothetical protein
VDTDAVIDFSYSAPAALPDSRLIVMPYGTHLAFYACPEAADVQQEARVPRREPLTSLAGMRAPPGDEPAMAQGPGRGVRAAARGRDHGRRRAHGKRAPI